MNHDLRITNAMTGTNPIVCIPWIKSGYDWRDFDGSLDAPNSIARGSTRRLEYDLCGMPMASEDHAVMFRASFL